MGLLDTLKRAVIWWDGQTIGTQIFTARHGEKVGEDEFGNIYYRDRRAHRSKGLLSSKEKRWVVYNGHAEATRGGFIGPFLSVQRKLADRLYGGQPEARLEYENIPTVVFTHPPIGTVGLTEAEAREKFGEGALRVYRVRFTPMYHALTAHRRPAVMKLVCTGDDERVVGHLVDRPQPVLRAGRPPALVRPNRSAHDGNT